MNLIIEAAQFAARAHAGQMRKYNGSPYITHPMRVAGRLCLLPCADEIEVAAAWLHDVIEDCGVKPIDFETELGLRGVSIASLVVELTNPSKGSTLPRKERKKMDREHIANASYAARVIKLIDRIDNLQEMTGCGDDFLAVYKNESALLLGALDGTDKELEAELAALIGI